MPKLIIDGKEYEVDKGRNCLEGALDHGLDLPYFCYHAALGSVGACRLCAVKTYKDDSDKTGRVVMSCMEPVTDGKRISIADPEVTAMRSWVIELLMTNHPHDCPICDEGGECHLQDMTVMTGHRTRRYRGKKRTFDNQYLGPLINHEMNRCIQCYRCVRYYQDYAGGHDLVAMASRNHTYFGRSEDGILENPFAGNLIDVCPTGVFTDKTLKDHYIRKWDQESAPSICTQCGMGCNTIPGARYGKLRRILPRYNETVNGYFICDRGRFGYEFNNSANRLREPQIQSNGTRQEMDRAKAWEHVQEFVRSGRRVAGIGSPRASIESNYALQCLVGSENFSTGLSEFDHRTTEAALQLYRRGPWQTPSLQDIEAADLIVILGADVTNEIPRIDLAVREAVRHGAALWLANSRACALDEIATEQALLSPAALPSFATKAQAAIKMAKRPIIIVGWHHGEAAVFDAASDLATQAREAKPLSLLVAFPEANTVGVGLLGGISVEAVLDQIEAGEIDRLIVVENDLINRVSNAPRLQKALTRVDKLLVLDHLETVTSALAHMVLPVATPVESNGTWVNAEGRAARAYQVYEPEPWVPQSWEVLRALPNRDGATRLDDWTSPETILRDLADQNDIFRNTLEITPPPGFRIAGQKVPRLSQRSSGRMAMPEIRDVREHLRPPEDTETPLSFSMEGTPNEPPSSLISRFWAPNWNSQEAINKFQIELGQGLHGGAPGKRLIEPGLVGALKHAKAPLPHKTPPLKADEILLVPTAEIFGSEISSRLSPAVAALIPAAYLEVHPDTAVRLKLMHGELREIHWDDNRTELTVRISERVAPDIAVVPARFPETRALHQPKAARIGEKLS